MTDAFELALTLIPLERRAAGGDIPVTLARFGSHALKFARDQRIAVIPLASGERYGDASAALARLGIDVDAWPPRPRVSSSSKSGASICALVAR